MIQLKVNGNFKELEKKLVGIKEDFETGNFLMRLAQLLNSSIQQRVQRFGRGSDGKSMSPYTKAYAAFKSASKRQIGFRDLTFSGKMWQSLTAAKIVGGVRMFFGSTQEANKASGNEEVSSFFKLSNKENDIVKREVKKITEGL